MEAFVRLNSNGPVNYLLRKMLPVIQTLEIKSVKTSDQDNGPSGHCPLSGPSEYFNLQQSLWPLLTLIP